MTPVADNAIMSLSGQATEELEAAFDDGDSTLPSSRVPGDDGDSTLPSARLPEICEDLDDAATPIPRRKRWDLGDAKQRKTARRLRGVRRLEQALEEGSRAAVLRESIAKAKEAGCDEPPNSQLVECAEARLLLVVRIEEAYESRDLDALRAAVTVADDGGAGAHAEFIRTELCAWEAQAVAMQALKQATSAGEMELALANAREAGVDGIKLADAEASLAVMRTAEARAAAMNALHAATTLDALEIAIGTA